MPKQFLGTCSLCGGGVSVPTSWMSVTPPRPTCERCGANAADYGPVIEMRPSVHRAHAKAMLDTLEQFASMAMLGKDPHA